MKDNGVYSICDRCINKTLSGRYDIICVECSHFYNSMFRQRPELRTCDNCIMADCEDYEENKLACSYWTPIDPE